MGKIAHREREGLRERGGKDGARMKSEEGKQKKK